jgi:hypothetical protein
VPVESLKAKDGAAAVPAGARLLSLRIGPVIALLAILVSPLSLGVLLPG